MGWLWECIGFPSLGKSNTRPALEIARLQQKQQDNHRGSVITTEVARLQQRHQGSHRGSKVTTEAARQPQR